MSTDQVIKQSKPCLWAPHVQCMYMIDITLQTHYHKTTLCIISGVDLSCPICH